MYLGSEVHIAEGMGDRVDHEKANGAGRRAAAANEPLDCALRCEKK